MSKYSPGPWHILPHSSQDCVWSADHVLVIRYAGGITAEQANANARLIAAAPDMLKALQEVVCVIEFEHLLRPDYGWKEWLDEEIMPAIAKATGEDE